MNFKTTIISTIMVAFIALFIVFIPGCKDEVKTWKYPVVAKVFMHNPGEYSFLYEEGNELKPFSISDNGILIYKIVTDAEIGSPMWAEVKQIIPTTGRDTYHLTIHIHKPSEINGGGWDNGKFGKGRQVEVE